MWRNECEFMSQWSEKIDVIVVDIVYCVVGQDYGYIYGQNV